MAALKYRTLKTEYRTKKLSLLVSCIANGIDESVPYVV